MKYITALLFASVLLADDAANTKAPQPKELSEHDELVLRKLQLKATEADDAYQKILAVPEVAKARQAKDDASNALGKTAKELSEKTCGTGARIQEKADANGDMKLYCVPPAIPAVVPSASAGKPAK